jgi:transposase-like protein
VYALVKNVGHVGKRTKRERTRKLGGTVLSLTHRSPRRTIDKYMVRFFTALCKSLLKNICDEVIFQEATYRYSYLGEACPHCGAVGKLAPHGDYTRGFTGRKDRKNVDSWLKPLRFLCKSCDTTHALLPDIVIPYGRYSLSFVLTVLIAYFERTTSVVNICEQFGIAVSTLYEWKKRMALHKDLMLGVLISRKTTALAFLRNLLGSNNLSDCLRIFFHKYGFSFMQNRSIPASRRRPP